MNNTKDSDWITVKDLAHIKKVSGRSIQRQIEKYIYRAVPSQGGKRYEILVSSLPPKIKFLYHNQIRHLPFTLSNLGNNVALLAIIKVNRFLEHPSKDLLLEVREACTKLAEECTQTIEYCKQLCTE